MHSFAKNVLVAAGALSAAAFIVVACGSSSDSASGDDAGVGSFGDASRPDVDLYANDPPPKWCGPDSQTPPPQPGGTEDCPDDKNKPGCGCDVLGATAPCWTGLRANRNLGVCKDGVATCLQINETRKGWSECVGQVLPTEGATGGAAACRCFSVGQWKLANLSPCLAYYNAPEPNPTNTYAVSTYVPDDGGAARCPEIGSSGPPTPASPVWTTNTLTADCAGKFKLCYELKAGSYENPLPTDCSLTKVCTEGVYEKEGVEQAFPDLSSWSSTDTACAYQWETSGGYGEMTVVGESVQCDKVDDGGGNAYVFNRVKYCPSLCRKAENSSKPECQNCQQGGSGTF